MVDHSYYITKYLINRPAVISAVDFPFFERLARVTITTHTHGKEENTDAFKMCVCEAAEILYSKNKDEAADISSEKVGDYSVTYKNKTSEEYNKGVQNTVYKWLGNTGLLFSGVE